MTDRDSRVLLRRLILNTLAFVAYFLARYYFIRWYNFLHISSYLAGALSFLLFVFAFSIQYFQWSVIRRCTTAHLVIIGTILFFLMPWGEWLQIGFLVNRKEWSLFWLNSLLFLYCCFVFAEWFSIISTFLQKQIEKFRPGDSGFWMYVLPLLVLIFASFICLVYLGGISHIQDGVSYLFEGKILASGKLWASAPPLPEFFSAPGDMMYMGQGKWFSIFLPGYPLFLAVGWMIKAPWIITPFLSALSLWLLMRTIKDQIAPTTALLFGLLFIFSPLVLILSSEFMAHVPELAAVSATIFSISQLMQRKNVFLYSLFLIFALVAAAAIRIFSSWTFLVPFIAYYCWNEFRARRYHSLLAPAAGLALGLVLVLSYQYETTGNALASGYQLRYPEYRYGFGPTFLHQNYTPLYALENTSNHLNSLNIYLSGWPCGSFIFLLLFFLIAKKIALWERLFLLGASMILLFYFFFVGIDLTLGPRHIFLVAPAVLLLNVRGLQLAWHAFPGKRHYLTIILIGCLSGFLLFSVPQYVLRSGFYTNIVLRQEIKKHLGDRHLLIFVTDDSRFSDDLAFNSPSLDGNVVIAKDVGAKNEELKRLYPSYESMYFRRATDVQRGGSISFGSHFGLFPGRGERSFQRVSYFQLLEVIRSTNQVRTSDIFDTCPTILSTDCDGSGTPQESVKYRREFHQAFDTLTRFLKLPLCAYLNSHQNWPAEFKTEEFRNLLYRSKTQFSANPELGGEVREALDKVQQRIDKNGDGKLSDEEILKFVAPKINEFKTYTFD